MLKSCIIIDEINLSFQEKKEKNNRKKVKKKNTFLTFSGCESNAAPIPPYCKLI